MKKSVGLLPCAPHVDFSVMANVVYSNDDIDAPNSDTNEFGCDDPVLLSSVTFELSLLNSTVILVLQ